MFHWLGRHFFIIYWIDIEMSNLSKIIIERYGYVGLVAVALIPTPPFRELALFMGISSGLEHTLSIVVAINALLVYLSIIVIF
ncbi:MAG: hypothetical protein UW72_C0007G0027 [Parcubacteria group bacterium GW2011_GWF2_44_7]|nr:MAG: hypothetical protein UW72_C0007G0027 [Parcubacteria group bacterium GW2011_GWF2_44_7]